VEVRSTQRADFFVFNDGDDPSGLGFWLCKACGRQVEIEGKKKPKVKAHRTPYSGKDCPCDRYDLVHLGHDFVSCAARLTFAATISYVVLPASPLRGRTSSITRKISG